MNKLQAYKFAFYILATLIYKSNIEAISASLLLKPCLYSGENCVKLVGFINAKYFFVHKKH